MRFADRRVNLTGLVHLEADSLSLRTPIGEWEDVRDIFVSKSQIAGTEDVWYPTGGGQGYWRLEWPIPPSDDQVPGLESLLRWIAENYWSQETATTINQYTTKIWKTSRHEQLTQLQNVQKRVTHEHKHYPNPLADKRLYQCIVEQPLFFPRHKTVELTQHVAHSTRKLTWAQHVDYHLTQRHATYEQTLQQNIQKRSLLLDAQTHHLHWHPRTTIRREVSAFHTHTTLPQYFFVRKNLTQVRQVASETHKHTTLLIPETHHLEQRRVVKARRTPCYLDVHLNFWRPRSNTGYSKAQVDTLIAGLQAQIDALAQAVFSFHWQEGPPI